MSDPIIRLENVFYTYPRSKKRALRGIDLSIVEGEFLVVMGENGAGKTTLCRLLNGIIPHSQGGVLQGTVTVDGKNTVDFPVAVLARTVGMVLDDPESQLFTARVRDEAAFGPENLLLAPEEIEKRVRHVLQTAGLWEKRDASPSALSGGQKQRLAVAAALALGGRILVLDEPDSHLDPLGARSLFSLVQEIRLRDRVTVVLATHRSEEAAECADRICVLKDGVVAACDAPCKIFGDAALLEDCSIRPPDTAALAAFLRGAGESFERTPLLLEDAAAAVNEWYNAPAGSPLP